MNIVFYYVKKRWLSIKKILVTFFIIGCFASNAFTQEPVFEQGAVAPPETVIIKESVVPQENVVKVDSIVVKFYAKTQEALYWFPSDESWFSLIKNWFSSSKNVKRANQWLTNIESAESLGIIVNKEQISQIRTVLSSKTKIDSTLKAKTDILITDLVLHFIKNLQQGNSTFGYDAISVDHDSLYISQMLKPRFLSSVSSVISSLDCKDPDYKVYKKFLRDSISQTDTLKRKIIILAMNYRRFISMNYQSEFILINIPQPEAEYFKNGVLAIKMRAVLGKKTKQTPTIASYVTSVTTFPNWNVPYEIAVNEILPKVQKNENYLEQNNYEVVDGNGNEIDDSELNWNNFNKTNFTYFFRQSSGSDNALGVVKFNLEDPFSVFLHGTSNQNTFSKEYRFLSHGCIRLEKPFDLADSLLRGKLDIEVLKTGETGKEPSVIMLHDKIPTFIIYMPVRIDGERVTFLNDEYCLIK